VPTIPASVREAGEEAVHLHYVAETWAVGDATEALHAQPEFLPFHPPPGGHHLHADLADDVVPGMRAVEAERSKPFNDSALLKDEKTSLGSP
jgi:hypothetical protein